MTDLHFLYGTLCHGPLRAVVLGRETEATAAVLSGHAAHLGQGAQQDGLPAPVLVAAADTATPGILVALEEGDRARLDFYEQGAALVARQVAISGAEVAALVPAPVDDARAIGPRWDFDAWQRDWAGIVTEAAVEYMALMGQVPAAAAAARHPMILVRAASRLRARSEAPRPAEVRRQTLPGDVVVDRMTTGYARFFAVEDYTLRHRRFAGTMSRPLDRATFVSGDATVVLPYDPVRDRVLLVEQFRAGPMARGDANPWQLEAIAGRVDAGETPAEAARREATEEAGLTLGALIEAPRFYPSPGAKSEYLYCYLALADLPDGAARPGGLEEEGEDIRPHLLSFAELMHLVETGEAENGPLIVLALWLAQRRDGLRKAAGIGA